ncbi:unnamed protein product [Closterium sp. Yama58-4]|nr:unnamed protein product [Closterium sp. Yama58-4]
MSCGECPLCHGRRLQHKLPRRIFEGESMTVSMDEINELKQIGLHLVEQLKVIASRLKKTKAKGRVASRGNKATAKSKVCVVVPLLQLCEAEDQGKKASDAVSAGQVQNSKKTGNTGMKVADWYGLHESNGLLKTTTTKGAETSKDEMKLNGTVVKERIHSRLGQEETVRGNVRVVGKDDTGKASGTIQAMGNQDASALITVFKELVQWVQEMVGGIVGLVAPTKEERGKQ